MKKTRSLPSGSFLLGGMIAVVASVTTTAWGFPLQSRRGGILAARIPHRPTGPSFALHAKARRGRLGSIVDAQDLLESKPSKRQKTTTPTKPSPKQPSAKKANTNVSPDLAAWAASTTSPADASTSTTVSPEAGVDGESSATLPDPTVNQKSRRREKQSTRTLQEEARDAAVKAAVQQINQALERKAGIPEILERTRELCNLESTNLRTLTAGAARQDYRLAWVGSDDAVCHIGTGLHKVPLARLQEVYLSLPGRNRVEMLEVIRILGPFPNVKNTLQGLSKLEGSVADNTATAWTISWDSMIDGTGKEVLAGKTENTRTAPLHVLFSDVNAIVAVVPLSAGGSPADVWTETNAANILVFIREDNLDDQLELLRVA
jgi:hypothetical protein